MKIMYQSINVENIMYQSINVEINLFQIFQPPFSVVAGDLRARAWAPVGRTTQRPLGTVNFEPELKFPPLQS